MMPGVRRRNGMGQITMFPPGETGPPEYSDQPPPEYPTPATAPAPMILGIPQNVFLLGAAVLVVWLASRGQE